MYHYNGLAPWKSELGNKRRCLLTMVPEVKSPSIMSFFFLMKNHVQTPNTNKERGLRSRGRKMNWILVRNKDPMKSKLSYKERKWHEVHVPWSTLSPPKFSFRSLIIMSSHKNKYLFPCFKMNKYVRKDRGHKTEIRRNMPTLRGFRRKWKDIKRGWEKTARETENYKKVLHSSQERKHVVEMHKDLSY